MVKVSILKMQKYLFHNYNQNYNRYFQQEKRKIKAALSLNPPLSIEHIGSTSVKKLGGKGIIDIALGIPKEKIKSIRTQLEKAGYEFRDIASTPTRLFFRQDYTYRNRVRRVHIHVVQFEQKEWIEMIAFRNYLQKNKETVKKYTQIKKEAVQYAQGDGQKYRRYKEKFIQNVLKKITKLHPQK